MKFWNLNGTQNFGIREEEMNLEKVEKTCFHFSKSFPRSTKILFEVRAPSITDLVSSSQGYHHQTIDNIEKEIK